jgi:hypothetical protein
MSSGRGLSLRGGAIGRGPTGVRGAALGRVNNNYSGGVMPPRWPPAVTSGWHTGPIDEQGEFNIGHRHVRLLGEAMIWFGFMDAACWAVVGSLWLGAHL